MAPHDVFVGHETDRVFMSRLSVTVTTYGSHSHTTVKCKQHKALDQITPAMFDDKYESDMSRKHRRLLYAHEYKTNKFDHDLVLHLKRHYYQN